jgi:hypothetical protein
VANPRKTPSRLGNRATRDTFIADGVTITFDRTLAGGAATTMLNKAVSLSADGTVQLASDGEAIIGKLILVEADLRCSVQDHGICELPGGTGATLTRGAAIVGALGAASAKGYIRIAASGTAAELILCRGRILANGTTTAVEVDLD